MTACSLPSISGNLPIFEAFETTSEQMQDSRDTQDCEEDFAMAQGDTATWPGLNDVFLQAIVDDG